MRTFLVKLAIVCAVLSCFGSPADARARSGLVGSINAQLARWVHPTGRCGGRELLATQYGRGDGTAGRPVACRGYGRFNPAGMTMASRIHKCGTVVPLTNPKNGRSVTLTVTDYGPGTHAVIDVSAGAAAALGMKSSDYLCEGGTRMAGPAPDRSRVTFAAKRAAGHHGRRATANPIYALDLNVH